MQRNSQKAARRNCDGVRLAQAGPSYPGIGSITMAQTLEIVYGFVNNVTVVINGMPRLPVCRSLQVNLS